MMKSKKHTLSDLLTGALDSKALMSIVGGEDESGSPHDLVAPEEFNSRYKKILPTKGP